jgi:hypothetical protein
MGCEMAGTESPGLKVLGYYLAPLIGASDGTDRDFLG